jgi:dimeric dUTPase (all-alpha-NTP-PPase superfamily)
MRQIEKIKSEENHFWGQLDHAVHERVIWELHHVLSFGLHHQMGELVISSKRDVSEVIEDIINEQT